MSAQADKRTTRFDAEAASYDASKPYLLPWADEAAKTLVPLIGMELGCGTGLVSQRVLKSTNPPVAFILGVDASEGMITAFNAKAAALAEDNGLVSPGSPLTLESPPRGMYAVYCMIEDDSSLRQSVAATPFADVLPTQDFDFVVSHITWHHIRDLNAMAKHIWRLLKPGGVFLIVDYEKTSDSIEFHPPSGRSEVEHLWGFSKDDLRGHLEGAGFVHVETRDVLTFERTGKDDGVTRKFTFIGAKGVKE